jgi:hypothetical protein
MTMGDFYFDYQTWQRLKSLKMDLDIGWSSDWIPESAWFTHRTLMLDMELRIAQQYVGNVTDWKQELAAILTEFQVIELQWEVDDSPGDAWVQVWSPRWKTD